MDGTYRELLSGPRRSETSAETSRKPKGAPSSFKLIYPVQNSNNINYRVNSYSTRLVNSIALFPDQVIPQMKRRLICMHHWSIHLNVTISRLTFCLFLLRKFVGVIFTPPDTASSVMHINNQLTDIHTQLKCLPVLQSAVQEIQATQNTMSSSLEFFNSIVEELRGKVESLETKNMQLQKRNEDLEKRVTELEKNFEEQNQYSRRENL